MTKTWIVMGDSWSVHNLSRFSTADFYDPRLSLPGRLARLYPDDRVMIIAAQGNSDIQQVHALNHTLDINKNNFDYNSVRVVWSWTDWTRGLQPEHNGNANMKNIRYMSEQTPPFRELEYDQNYAVSLQQHRTKLKRTFNSMNKIGKHLRFYHWGGHSEIWCDPRTNFDYGTHTILYQDYCRSVHAAPPANAGIQSYFTWSDWFKRSEYGIQTLFPNTDDALVRKLNRTAKELSNYKHNKTRLYPDGGHLAWEHYDVLVKNIHAHEQRQGRRTR
jgi:hypothetical protein